MGKLYTSTKKKQGSRNQSTDADIGDDDEPVDDGDSIGDHDAEDAGDEPVDALDDAFDGAGDIDDLDDGVIPLPKKKLRRDNWRGAPLQAHPDHLRDGVMAVPEWARLISEDGNEAFVLAYLDYWLGYGDNGKVRTDAYQGEYDVVARTYAEMAGFIECMNARQVEHAVTKLIKRGFVEGGVKFYKGRRKAHLRLRADTILKAYEQAQLKQDVEEED